ncbi:MAG: beta-glucoside-specific PTS transporter subunit IIABC [Dermabacter sp.]|nr:beta-glucoside-specific PTS transporter subunit IIABC [Dermabacter sp.]
MGKYQDLATQILAHVGGKDNVASLSHCFTRLRFKLHDGTAVDEEALNALDGVVTVVQSGGQHQVVIGNHVADVYAELTPLIGEIDEPQQGATTGNLFDRFIDMISGIFQPVLGIMAAAGMIKGFNVMFQTFGLYPKESGIYILLGAIGDALFLFMPIILGYTAAQKFKVRPMVGLVLGAVLCHPAIQLSTLSAGDAGAVTTLLRGTMFESPVYLDVLGLPLIAMDYTSTVIPVIVVVYFASKIERFFDRIVPSVVKFFFVPMMTILIASIVGLLLIGPVTTFASTAISEAVLALRGVSPLLAGAVVGGTWQILVIFGLHWAFIPVFINNVLTLGFDNVMMPFFGCTFATAGVVAAIYFRTKNRQLKDLSLPAFISGIFGVTEPAIYGILLPLKKPFIISCIVGAIAGGFFGALDFRKFMLGGIGIFEFPGMIAPDGSLGNLLVGITGAAIAFVLAFVITFIVFTDDPMAEETIDRAVDESDPAAVGLASGGAAVATAVDLEVSSPLSGRVIPLADADDAAFASGVLGQGVVIDPSEGVVTAPFDGTVTALFPTLHAIGLTADDGRELLIHIGINTVQLNGEGFTASVSAGDRVRRGDVLITFDIARIVAAGYSVHTPVVLTNATTYLDVVVTQAHEVGRGDALLTPIALSR